MGRSVFGGMTLLFNAIKVGFQMLRSGRILARVRMPIVTIWGGTRVKQDSKEAQQAFEFARQLAQHNISVITGGGPGIMQAANCGAQSVRSEQKNGKKINSLGIGVKFVDAEYKNPCSPVLRVDYFFIRKWLMMRNAIAFVIFPGGVGTMDELFELMNFMKHGKIPPLPVILIGKEFWQPIIDWMHKKAFANGYVRQYQLDFLYVTDDLSYAFSLIHDMCQQYKNHFK